MRRSFLSWLRRPVRRPVRTRLNVEPLEDRSLLSVSVLGSFEGLSSADGGAPPNPQLAAGPEHVVEVVDSAVAFFNKATGERVFQQTLRDFLDIPAGDGRFLDAPLVTFDEQAGRFVVAVQWGNRRDEPDTLGFAVSNSANPLDGFQELHRLPTFGTRAAQLGWNADALVFAFDGFCPSGVFCFVDPFTSVVSIDKATVLDVDPATLTMYRSSIFIQGDRIVTPAVMHGAAPGGPMWLMTEYGPGDLRLIRMDNVLSSQPVFTTTSFEVAGYRAPPPAAQVGSGLIGTGDSRITNVAWRGDRLVAAQTVGVDDVARARWYEFSTGGDAPALAQSGEINPGPGIHTYLPSIEIAANGDLGMTFVQSAEDSPLAMYVTGRTAADEAGTMQTPVLVQSVEAPYFDRSAGFYSGISVDPQTGNSFWAANQFAAAIRSGVSNWATQIAHFSLAEVPPPPQRVELTGILRTDIFAIGGETTGIVIFTDQGDFELELGENKELRRLAEQLHGRRVIVTGILTQVPGVEIPIRNIVIVETLRAADPAPDFIDVTGILRTDIAAIGGETTGIVIFTDDGNYELADLLRDGRPVVSEEFRRRAQDFHLQRVRVTGILTIVEGIEIRQRRVIIVESLEFA